MDSLQLIASVVCGLFAFLRIYYLLKKLSSNKEAPQLGGAWPIIGHLHLLGRVELPHIFFSAMADKYGPAFMIQLGMRRALVVSSAEIAKECLTTNDKALATRPSSIAAEIMGYDYAMFGLGPYGDYWREVRKIVVLEFLSNRRLELLKHVRVSEISLSLKELYQSWEKQNKADEPVLVHLDQWFGDMTLNLSVRMVAGKRYFGATAACGEDESRKVQKATREFDRLLGLFVVSDYLPFLRWLDLEGHQKLMKSIGRELDSILQGWLDEHKTRRNSGGGAKGDQDFIDVMLSVLEDGNLSNYDADKLNKATSLTMIVAGSETTMVTLTWAVCLLLNNPEVLNKAQDELDMHIGKDRQVEESDIKNLAYLQAVIKETMRLYPVAPLLIPHEAMEDCTIAGYHVRAGTRVILNGWKLQRDPFIWSDPCEFQPERFLNNDVDVRGRHFELLPFGSGRRACPGISLALNVVSLTLARLLHEFKFSNPSEGKVDMSESAGVVVAKATPLEVLIIPRLPSKFYEYYKL